MLRLMNRIYFIENNTQPRSVLFLTSEIDVPHRFKRFVINKEEFQYHIHRINIALIAPGICIGSDRAICREFLLLFLAS